MKKILIPLLLFISVTASAQYRALIEKDTVNLVATKTNVNAKADTSSIIQTPDYIIEKVGSTYYARPGYKSGLPAYSGSDAYTVIQNSINALTPTGGGVGSAGGKIFINVNGSISLSNELTITGWENSIYPYSQITIEGKGWATNLVQNTANKNGLVIKNDASVNLFNLKITVGASGKSAILGDNTGSNYEISVNRGVWDNLFLISSNASYPALWMKNFININAGYIIAQNTAGDGILMENVSTTIEYGNSSFNLLKAVANTTSGIGLHIRSSTSAQNMDLLSFSHYECLDSYKGILIEDAANIHFDYVDIENAHYPVGIGLTTALNAFTNTAYNISIKAGLLVSSTGGTCITSGGSGGGGNSFGPGLIVDCDATGIPIKDYNPGLSNQYNVIFGFNTDVSKVSFTTPSHTSLKYTSLNGGTSGETLMNGTTATTPTARDSSTKVATTAYVDNLKINPNISAYKALGSAIKAETIGVTLMNITTSVALADGLAKIIPVYLSTPQTLTGVQWYQAVQGVYTGDNYNGALLCTYAAGTYTVVASSTNDANIWTVASNTWGSKAFSSPYSAQAGLYFIVLVYNSSAQTTAPTIGSGAAFTNAAVSGADFTNSGVLAGFASVSTLPTTIAATSVTKSTQNYYANLY
jgi:hypothetical protein